MSSYATPADMLALKDARTVGALVKDDGTRASATALATDPNLLAALQAASGEVEAAVMQGGRYTVADLQALTDNSAAYLKELVCKIAWARLWARRPYDKEHAEAIREAQDALEMLRLGKHVFNLPAQINAGTPTITGPSVVEYQQLNTIVGRSRGKFYPLKVEPVRS
jgi:hypothetical protein